MFEISIESSFDATHAILIHGEREPINGHSWHVTATIEAVNLDREGMICDFHAAARALEGVLAPFHNANLNDLAPFSSGVNPTAENVAAHIGESLRGALAGILPVGARVASVRLTEAPGCAATYRPPPDRP